LEEPLDGVFRGETISHTTTHAHTLTNNTTIHSKLKTNTKILHTKKPQHIHAARSSKKPPGLKASRWGGRKSKERGKKAREKKTPTHDASRQGGGKFSATTGGISGRNIFA